MKLYTPNHPAVEVCCGYFNERVFERLPTAKFWIAGGAIRDWWLYRKPKSDIDLWFPCAEQVAIAKLDAELAGWKLTKETNASVNYRTDKGQWVQFVQKHYFDSLIATLEKFDFTVCCAGIDRDGTIVVHNDFFIDLAMKRLALNTIPYPVSTFKRSAKYAEKGFRFCPKEQQKLFEAVQAELLVGTIEDAEEKYME